MLKVRASPAKIDFIRKQFPAVQLAPQTDGIYSVGNIEVTKLIALLKAQGIALEQQDALLVIKDVEQAANTMATELPTPAPETQAQSLPAAPETQAQSLPAAPETPKAAVYEHFDQAFTTIISGMLAPKFVALEAKLAEIAKSVKTLADRYDMGKIQLEASIQNAERQAKDAAGKISSEAQRVKDDIEARLVQFKTEIASEINNLDVNIQKVDTELKQCVATQETTANTSKITAQTNLEEHKKMQENLARIVKHFQDIPLSK